MKETYINEYTCDKEFLRNRLLIALNKQVKKTYFLDILIVIACITMLISTKTVKTIFVILAIILIVYLIINLLKQMIINKELKKYEEKNLNITNHLKIDFKKECIIKNQKMQLNFSFLESVSQNKNWIILTIKGGEILMLKKESFTSGDSNECYKKLKEYIKTNKHNV